MDQNGVAVTNLSSRRKKIWRFVGRLLIASFAVVIALAVDLSPTVPVQKAPTAEQARRARDTARIARILLSDGKGFATLRVDRDALASLTTLASALGRYGRFDTAIDKGTLKARGSRQFGFLWLNIEAQTKGSARGFPETRLKVGNLNLGKTVSSSLIDLGHFLARQRGIAVPPLDNLVRSVRIEPDSVSASVHFPLKGAFANELSGLRSQPIDARLTAALYCRLVAFDRRAPTADFAIVVRRAFAPTKSVLPIVEQNRAAFVALAIYATDSSAGRLAGDATKRIRSCRRAVTDPRLAGRADLAKHWALSAALGVSLGDDVGSAMGEWKELSDSRPGGSGFSFVDLAADRAGLAIARRASDPSSANLAATRLRVATSGDLVPVKALALSEGLSEKAFVTSYAAIDSTRFASAKARIDKVIEQTVGR
jgi:uncharacterized protein YfiM (DUF2279 family)